MSLPDRFYDDFSKLPKADRAALARMWLNRGLAMVAPWVRHGDWLRVVSRRPPAQQDLGELTRDLMRASSMTADEEHQMFDRLLAIIGELRREQYARVAESLVQIASVVDAYLKDPDFEPELGAASSTSSVAISSVSAPRARTTEEIVEQLVANVQQRAAVL